MGWEVWFDNHPERSYGQMGFFCNTTDHSFGPVFMTDDYFDKSQFYKLWETAGWKDPRTDDDNISKHTRHLINLMSWEDRIVATMKVYRADGINAPVLIFEKSVKDSYDSISFSAFEDPIEALPEKDFEIVEELIEIDLNDGMKHLILMQDPYDEDIKRSAKAEGDGYMVVMEWEVLDEYQVNRLIVNANV